MPSTTSGFACSGSSTTTCAGLQNRQQLEVRLDGERVALFTIGGAPGTPPPRTFAGAVLGDRTWEEYALHADDDIEVRISAKAGPRVLGVSFVQGRSERDGVLQPRATGKVLAVAERWSSPSEAPEAAVDQVGVAGPFNASGAGDTPSRQRLFTCHPTDGADAESCAREILGAVARRAFRRPVTGGDLDTLLGFYAAGRRDGGFETGIQRAWRASWSIRSSCSASSATRWIRSPARYISSATWSWRRDCRSSSGAASRTNSCWTPPRAGICASRPCWSARCGACWPMPARRRWWTASPCNGWPCAPCRTWCRRRSCSRSGTTTCARRSSARRSCSWRARFARTAASWTWCGPTTRSPTSGWPGTTGFPTSTATGFAG